MNTTRYWLGVDVGSTTAKMVVLNAAAPRELVYSAYRRHNAETLAAVQALLQEAHQALGECTLRVCLTGSAGLGVCEKYGLPFIQEVIASTEVIRQRYPQVNTLLDIGGEDAKLIFFDGADASGVGSPDIRMNGACAGGTGAFIDQMASLLNASLADLNALAERHTTLFPIASRCGVFAKTDVQNLLSRETAREDIAASIFNAVVWQTLATLARGHSLRPKLLFAGGPLTFLSALRAAFATALNLKPGDWVEVEHGELLSAWGAALAAAAQNNPTAHFSMEQLIERLSQPPSGGPAQGRLAPLFSDPAQFQQWEAVRATHQLEQTTPATAAGQPCFLGIDSGSTTTKLILTDAQGRPFFDYYAANNGSPLGAVQAGLQVVRALFAQMPAPPRLARSAVTGYGEDLVRAALGCDGGLVETVAHFRAARAFDPDVSFILDIGGQDMKAIFVKEGHLQRIEVNEACSSGCGTFIETFARSLGASVSDFAQAACQSEVPCDLGTRCTVFMNSRVKQALREGAAVRDISAGLAYAVIKNALHKVLKLTDLSVLGDHIVVQGGAFRNPAIHRALEQVLGKAVICPDKAELMGAWGAALEARDAYLRSGQGQGLSVSLDDLASATRYQKQALHCRGCENQCAITRLTFPNQNVFYTGNRCERIFSNRGVRARPGANLFQRKRELLFERPAEPALAPRLTLGLPRALNLYENYPFWCTLFVECGIRVKLSAPSSQALFEAGAGTVMSENICFPAKLLHGHIFNLAEAGVDRIFYPMVFYERSEFADAINCFNCPIVSGYPDVVRSAIDPQRQFGLPFDQPSISFQDPGLLRQNCGEYLAGLGVTRPVFERAFALAQAAQARFKTQVRQAGTEILERAKAASRLAVVLAGHPYHLDPLINHKIPEALAAMGVDVLTEDAVPLAAGQELDHPLVLSQWSYLNRCFHAARWVGQQNNVEMAQLNSFGCGPDAFALDEVKGILSEYGKSLTVLRIDEIDSLGSARLRLRSMLEVVKGKEAQATEFQTTEKPTTLRVIRQTTRLYRAADRRKTILVPEFSRFCTPPIVRPVIDMGYAVEVLPPSDRASVEVGLKYANNEICYPGLIVIGDAIKALQSGRYAAEEVIVGSWETGGQCRASNISCLLKKALVAAGYENVPVVTLSTRLKSFNPQPEFRFNLAEYVYKALLGMAYTDGLSGLYHAAAVRERSWGDAQVLADKWLKPFETGQMPVTRAAVLDNLRQAVADFGRLALRNERLPRVGIVGEIYVKYNPFVNSHIAQWLMNQGVEVVLPPFLTFFLGSFVGLKAGVEARIRRLDALAWVTRTARPLVQAFVGEVESILSGFRFYPAHRPITDIAQTAASLVQLTHQYGEGWLLPGEVGEFVRAGVTDVLCLQPFGCIANHVVAKGVSGRLKATYPQLNLLFLDLDAGGSEVNLFNRAHFFVEQARQGQAS